MTKGGLVFVGGGEPALTILDKMTGAELRRIDLPRRANATPMTYQLTSSGKQYLVIAAGGHPKISEEKQSDALVAFTLP